VHQAAGAAVPGAGELIANARKLVSRKELQQKLWPADTFVDFDVGVNTAIGKLRQALNDDARLTRLGRIALSASIQLRDVQFPISHIKLAA